MNLQSALLHVLHFGIGLDKGRKIRPIDLNGKQTVVIGAGAVGVRKPLGLVGHGAKIVASRLANGQFLQVAKYGQASHQQTQKI